MDEPGPVEDRTDAAEPETAGPADAIEAHIAEPQTTEPPAVDSQAAEPEVAEHQLADHGPTGFETAGSDLTGSDVAVDEVAAVAVETVEPEAGDGEPVAEAEPVSTEDVAAEVAEQLGSVVGEDVEADPAEFAAAAVLDVLRAAGWADASEAAELRAEATRLRELLAEVIRDHRAREASAAGGQNQQLYWLVPLLRAAHGVAFGSLGAKVALRTAVQEVPPEVLASAGLRIDYGVEPAYDDQ